MLKILLLVISFSIYCIFPQVWANTWSTIEDKSIKEIKQNIEKLNQDKNYVNSQLTVHTKNNHFIMYLAKNWYFRDTITQDEFLEIEKLITTYTRNFTLHNQKLLDKAEKLEDYSDEKAKLLELKKELYQNFIVFVKQERYDDYLEFIKSDAQLLKQNSEVNWELIINKQVLDNKVEKIEEKIIEEKRKTQERIKQEIIKKIDEKLNQIKTNEKFLALPIEYQISIIDKTIEKVNLNIQKVSTQNNTDNTKLQQKLDILGVLLDKLVSYKNYLESKKQWEL